MVETNTPARLNLKKDRGLDIEWRDGSRSFYSLTYLRSMCPCAACKAVREGEKQKKSLLTILPGNYAGELLAVSAELVGGYAIKIEWSDQHASGIYSFQYLREIAPPTDGPNPPACPSE
jgi:DUF971 family protein